ncbi:hypothetical protein CEXT_654261 [Caerostris extrusa]|uniref:Uncharacterized protein n=1 Tax=Caerostris extrusa TaxID=172846 RepID=A0AAV4XEF7_CAEEX|nr:hypothetical protein CEXT_654261 [Caerostris extrusa]
MIFLHCTPKPALLQGTTASPGQVHLKRPRYRTRASQVLLNQWQSGLSPPLTWFSAKTDDTADRAGMPLPTRHR